MVKRVCVVFTTNVNGLLGVRACLRANKILGGYSYYKPPFGGSWYWGQASEVGLGGVRSGRPHFAAVFCSSLSSSVCDGCSERRAHITSSQRWVI